MREVTQELYAASIPKCCLYQTMEQHVEHLMLCWGLSSSIKNDTPMDCGFCELNTKVTAEARKEHWDKIKTFNILKETV